MNTQFKELLKTGEQDRVEISLMRYEQMRHLIDTADSKIEELKKENDTMIEYLKKLGIPIDAEIILDSFSVVQYFNPFTQRIKYCIDFEVIPDREMH